MLYIEIVICHVNVALYVVKWYNRTIIFKMLSDIAMVMCYSTFHNLFNFAQPSCSFGSSKFGFI